MTVTMSGSIMAVSWRLLYNHFFFGYYWKQSISKSQKMFLGISLAEIIVRYLHCMDMKKLVNLQQKLFTVSSLLCCPCALKWPRNRGKLNLWGRPYCSRLHFALPCIRKQPVHFREEALCILSQKILARNPQEPIRLAILFVWGKWAFVTLLGCPTRSQA